MTIKSVFSDNKVTANQLAKQTIASVLDTCSYHIEDITELTDQEKAEVYRHLNKHIDAIYKKLDVNKLYQL